MRDLKEKKRILSKYLITLSNCPQKQLLAGFDGFVDEIIHVVDQRQDEHHYSRIMTIEEYGERIQNSAGLSTNFENIVVQKKAGGNGTIYAIALQKLGCSVRYIGAVGKDEIHPVFRDFSCNAEVIGICDPAETEAIEFMDGKLICSKLSSFSSFNWDNLSKHINLSTFAKYIDDADMISFNNWTMLNQMSDCWEHILDDVLPLTKKCFHEKKAFFDLADPQKRRPEDLLIALRLIERFQSVGFKTTLGLNLKEAIQVIKTLGLDADEFSVEQITRALGERLNLYCVVVHPTNCAACITEGKFYMVEGPYCNSPKLTTGAGDNFNAGFSYGLMWDMPMENCLLCGVSSSGYYVRNGGSASLIELSTFLSTWASGDLSE